MNSNRIQIRDVLLVSVLLFISSIFGCGSKPEKINSVPPDVIAKFRGHWETAPESIPLFGEVISYRIDVYEVDGGLVGKYDTPHPQFGRYSYKLTDVNVVDSNTIEFDFYDQIMGTSEFGESLNTEAQNKARFRLVWISDGQAALYPVYHWQNDEVHNISRN